ncbi:hypothetical protein R1flu_021799 [Riccia fluitans]|uniref:Uncharacterized protein n=1 Tax=Riccia fluitans TaxID=41844 RepID=A0ABD1ZQD9_9MARC
MKESFPSPPHHLEHMEWKTGATVLCCFVVISSSTVLDQQHFLFNRLIRKSYSSSSRSRALCSECSLLDTGGPVSPHSKIFGFHAYGDGRKSGLYFPVEIAVDDMLGSDWFYALLVPLTLPKGLAIGSNPFAPRFQLTSSQSCQCGQGGGQGGMDPMLSGHECCGFGT